EHAHGDARQWVRQVVARDEVDYALVLERGRGVNLDDARVCVRAAQDRRVQRARALEVVDEAASAREEPTVLLAPQRAPNDALGLDARYHRYLISTQAPRRVRLPRNSAAGRATAPAGATAPRAAAGWTGGPRRSEGAGAGAASGERSGEAVGAAGGAGAAPGRGGPPG